MILILLFILQIFGDVIIEYVVLFLLLVFQLEFELVPQLVGVRLGPEGVRSQSRCFGFLLDLAVKAGKDVADSQFFSGRFRGGG